MVLFLLLRDSQGKSESSATLPIVPSAVTRPEIIVIYDLEYTMIWPLLCDPHMPPTLFTILGTVQKVRKGMGTSFYSFGTS